MNLIDLDSNPTKLMEVVLIGKQLLMTRTLHLVLRMTLRNTLRFYQPCLWLCLDESFEYYASAFT